MQKHGRRKGGGQSSKHIPEILEGKPGRKQKLYCPGSVFSSANRGSLRSHAPRICAALPEISWSVWASSGIPYEDRDLRNDRTTPVLPHPPKRSVCSKWQVNSDLL